MAANEKLFLFAVAMTLAALACLLVWLERFLSRRHRIKEVTPDSVIEKFCVGEGFNLDGLLTLFEGNEKVHNVEFGMSSYRATLNDGRTRLYLSITNKGCFLEKIEYYCDANWQFQGWYACYDIKYDKTSPQYRVSGVDINDHEAACKELPTFWLTGRAIRQLTLYFIERSHERGRARR